jgi:hypothetical protein
LRQTQESLDQAVAAGPAPWFCHGSRKAAGSAQ